MDTIQSNTSILVPKKTLLSRLDHSGRIIWGSKTPSTNDTSSFLPGDALPRKNVQLQSALTVNIQRLTGLVKWGWGRKILKGRSSGLIILHGLL